MDKDKIPPIPESGADEVKRKNNDNTEDKKINIIPEYGNSYIVNIMNGKELLTPQEALLQIQQLSGALLIDGIRRTQAVNPKYL